MNERSDHDNAHSLGTQTPGHKALASSLFMACMFSVAGCVAVPEADEPTSGTGGGGEQTGTTGAPPTGGDGTTVGSTTSGPTTGEPATTGPTTDDGTTGAGSTGEDNETSSGTTSTNEPDGLPVLVAIEIPEDGVVELSFSEPIADPSEVDPASFRLSFGHVYEYSGDLSTYYYALEDYSGGVDCYEYCYCPDYADSCPPAEEICYDYCFGIAGPPVHVIALSAGGVPEQIRLQLSSGLAGMCPAVAGFGNAYEEAGLFLHYTSAGIPNIVDGQGEELEAIAEHWAIPPTGSYAYADGSFPEAPFAVPILCKTP